MTNSQDPFFPSKVECPVCGSINEYMNIRPASYRETNTDTDFFPSARVWRNAAYQKYDPLYFFMATCEKCFYTREFNAEFKGWERDAAFAHRRDVIQQKHRAALAEPNGVVPFLGRHLDQEKHPIESAIIKFILGIYDELLTEPPSSLKLGRYFLRTAWLFRSQGSQGQALAGETATVLERLRSVVSDANSALRAYEHKVNDLRSVVGTGLTSILKDKAPDLLDEQTQVMSEVAASLPPLLQAQLKLAEISDRAEQALRADDSQGKSFYTFASFREFLIKAKQLWNNVPTTENEALSEACEYYKKAYDRGVEIGDGVAQVQAAYLIAELSRRIGDFTGAERYFNVLMRVGWQVVNAGSGNAATVNRTRKLLEMGREQARLNKEAQAARASERP
jgi:hypothetical protein